VTGKSVELRRGPCCGLEGRHAGPIPRPFKGIPQRCVQCVDLGESLATERRQTIEGLLAIGLHAAGQGIDQQAGDAKGRQECSARATVCARLEARAFCAQRHDLFLDRGAASKLVPLRLQDDHGRDRNSNYRNHRQSAAQASCRSESRGASRHAPRFSTTSYLQRRLAVRRVSRRTALAASS
jgi:hypothetical protein